MQQDIISLWNYHQQPEQSIAEHYAHTVIHLLTYKENMRNSTKQLEFRIKELSIT